MSIVIRHGAGSHFVRPDGVYRTSVLQSVGGYQPQADVQAVATAFTSPFGPNGLTGLSSWWESLKAKWAARKFLRGMNGLGGPGVPGVPAWAQANQIAPQIQTQMQMLAMLAPGRGGGPMTAAYDAGTRRLASYYVAG